MPQKLLERPTHEMDSILDAIRRGAEIIDAEFNVRYVSEQCRRIYGNPANRKCYEYFMDRCEPCPKCSIVEARRVKAPIVTEKILPRRFNRIMQVTTIPFQVESGKWWFALISVDISNRKRAEETLRESEERLRSILDALPDMIVQVDPDMNIIWANKRALDMNPDALGQTCFKAYVDRDEPCEGCPCSRAIRTGNIEMSTMYQPITQGIEGSCYWEDIGVPLKDKRGDVTSVIEIARDVTERKRAEHAVHHYIEELKARNEELDAFSHTVAHDLKNLLGVLINCGYVLEQGHERMPREKILRYAQKILNNGQKMINIIDELMLLARVRTLDEVKTQPLHMERIVEDAIGRLEHLIKEYNANITFPKVLPKAVGYGPWVEEVWLNYLSNAIKYGGKPPCVELGATPGSNGIIRFWVKDNGPGFPPGDQSRLFHPFTQINQARIEGHGLGLSIVRRIVERLGGEVGVESRQGKGSTFFFTLKNSKG